MKTGSCLCGAVRFEITGDLRPVIACHCEQCRKTSGHYVAATSAARNDIKIDGDVTWYVSSQTARRGFCGTCGSSLFWDGPGENISIHAGTLDGETGLSIKGHIFCDDKADYYSLPGDIPCAAQSDLSLTTTVVE